MEWIAPVLTAQSRHGYSNLAYTVTHEQETGGY